MTSSQGDGSSPRRSISSTTRKKAEKGLSGDRTVKRLRLSRALTVPATTSISVACGRMVSRRADALLLTDSNALLCGILTDKDIALRVIALEVNLKETPVSEVMTRNPVFVLSDTLAVEALQKMVQGKFRHLPVVENGEVISILDIAKCLYDAIARMERIAEKGKAVAAAVEGVKKHWGTSVSGPNSFIESLREQIFRPCLSTIVTENSKVVTVDPSDTVLATAKNMLEFQASCAIVTVENKPCGILTSKDMLMRVIAQDLPPDSIIVEKVMTPNPECASIDAPIIDALHTMHDGKFLHLPVVDSDGFIVAVVDVLHIAQAAVETLGNTAGVSSEAANSMMQNFRDSAMALTPDDEEDTRRGPVNLYLILAQRRLIHSLSRFKTEKEECTGLYASETQNLSNLIASVLQRVGSEIDRNNLPQILYEDEDRDKVVLATDGDLQAAVDRARRTGWKGLRLHVDYSGTPRHRRSSNSGDLDCNQADAWAAVAAGAALVGGLGVYVFLRRYRN